MKTVAAIVLSIVCFSANAQRVNIKKGEIEIIANPNESVNDAFALIQKITPVKMKLYDRYVVKDGKTYYRSPLNKRKTYLVEDSKLRKL